MENDEKKHKYKATISIVVEVECSEDYMVDIAIETYDEVFEDTFDNSLQGNYRTLSAEFKKEIVVEADNVDEAVEKAEDIASEIAEKIQNSEAHVKYGGCEISSCYVENVYTEVEEIVCNDC